MGLVNRSLRLSFAVISGFVCHSALAVADDTYGEDDPTQRPLEDDEDAEQQGNLEDEGLKTGGLTAPGALGEPGDNRSQIEKDLDKSDEKDSGRGLEFVWLSADIGFQAVGLSTFSDAAFFEEGASGSGISYGGAGGLRLLYFTLGARFWYSDQGPFQFWSLLGEASLRVPLGKLEPFVLLGAGYAKASKLTGVDALGGADVRVAVGTDYYFSDSFSVGGQVGADLLFLKNSTLSTTGAAAMGMLLLGLHF
jgi:hypothetical protein